MTTDLLHETGDAPACPDPGDVGHAIRQYLIGASQWTRAAADAAAALAADNRPILFEGETGSGRHFLAQLIHRCSARGNAPFVCLPGRGAPAASIHALVGRLTRPVFAHRARLPLLERARGGMLFLDLTSLRSVLPPGHLETLTSREVFAEAAARLLDSADVRLAAGFVLEGERGPQRLDPRDGPAACELLAIWPLRARRDDIEPLARHFVADLCRRARREPNEISAEALEVLRRHDWPGNVGELRRVVEQMVHRAKPACLDSSLIPDYVAHASPTGAREPGADERQLNGRVRDFEVAIICEALDRCQQNVSAAARLLGVKVSTLHSKLRHYGLPTKAMRT